MSANLVTLARVNAELERLQKVGLLRPALRQLFSAMVFMVEAAEDPENEAEQLLRAFVAEWALVATQELEGCTCQASRRGLVLGGFCTGCGKFVGLEVSNG